MSSEKQSLVINGWRILAHSLFLDRVEELIIQVEQLRQKDPLNFRKKNATRRLAAIFKLAFETIPQDPTRSEYRQGNTLGDSYKHWFRAKFFQQYRLFFRFHLESKIIVFAWVNVENSKRAYGSRTDAYRVFANMLDGGNPPNAWEELIATVKDEIDRLDSITEASPTEIASSENLED